MEPEDTDVIVYRMPYVRVLRVWDIQFFDAVLPFLEKTTFFLYPIGFVIILSPICKYPWLFYVIFFSYIVPQSLTC